MIRYTWHAYKGAEIILSKTDTEPDDWKNQFHIADAREVPSFNIGC